MFTCDLQRYSVDFCWLIITQENGLNLFVNDILKMQNIYYLFSVFIGGLVHNFASPFVYSHSCFCYTFGYPVILCCYSWCSSELPNILSISLYVVNPSLYSTFQCFVLRCASEYAIEFIGRVSLKNLRIHVGGNFWLCQYCVYYGRPCVRRIIFLLRYVCFYPLFFAA